MRAMRAPMPPIERLPDVRRLHGCPGRGDRVGWHDEYRGPRWAYRDPHVGHSRLVGIAQQFAVGASVRSGVHLNPGALSQVHAAYLPIRSRRNATTGIAEDAPTSARLVRKVASGDLRERV